MEKEGKQDEEEERTAAKLMLAFGRLLREGCLNNEDMGICYVLGCVGPADPDTGVQELLFQSNAVSLSVVAKIMSRMLDEAALMEEDPVILTPDGVSH